MKTLLITLLFTSLNSLLYADIQFEKKFETALKLAEKEDKLIFVDFYTDWCGPCKALEKFIFNNPKVSNYYNTVFVNIKINAEKGKGIELAKKYDVDGYPTLIFLDSKGRVKYRGKSAFDIDKFIDLGKRANDPAYYLKQMNTRFNAGVRSQEFLDDYLVVLFDHEQYERKSAAFEIYCQQGYINSNDLLFKLSELHLYRIDSDLFTKLNEIAFNNPDKLHAYRISIQSHHKRTTIKSLQIQR